MDDFGFLRDVTIGQYLPGRSVVHRLDPRTKLIALIVLVWIITSVTSYLGIAVLTASALGLIELAGLPTGFVLRGIRPLLPVLTIYLLFQLLFGGNYDPTGSPVLWQWHPPSPLPIAFTITETSLRLAFVSILRLLCLLIVTSVLTFTTTATDLTHGLELLLTPLRPLRFPAHELAMTLAIALRFVPTLAEELERIMKAQASRGADFGRPGRLQAFTRVRQLVPIVVPMFVSVFRRSEELVLAMEARAYDGRVRRGRLHPPTMRRRDWIALVVVATFAALVAAIPWPA
ncbi:MAG: energy-coupling factor transporter transmembrane protein EcfT [Chloroflexi bacterium]|nr:energy-coupling factor transporter transmembrane protein EcfT [Chloroflexota bacterium]